MDFQKEIEKLSKNLEEAEQRIARLEDEFSKDLEAAEQRVARLKANCDDTIMVKDWVVYNTSRNCVYRDNLTKDEADELADRLNDRTLRRWNTVVYVPDKE